MQAGKLDRLIALQHRTLTRGPSGEQVASYSSYDNVWAEKRDLRGREYFAAQQVNPELQTTWRIRWNPSVVITDHILDDDGLEYEIVHMAEIGRRKGMDLVCRAIRS